MHDVLTIGIPTFVVLLGILLGRRDTSDLTRRLDALESKVDRRFDVLQHDLQEFYRITGKLEGRVEEIAKR